MRGKNPFLKDLKLFHFSAFSSSHWTSPFARLFPRLFFPIFHCLHFACAFWPRKPPVGLKPNYLRFNIFSVHFISSTVADSAHCSIAKRTFETTTCSCYCLIKSTRTREWKKKEENSINPNIMYFSRFNKRYGRPIFRSGSYNFKKKIYIYKIK